MSPSLYIIRGLPGSGKSTEAKRIEAKNPNNFRHIEADMYFMVKDKYNFNRSRLRQAHAWCQSKTEEYLKQGYNVVVSNTFTTVKEIAPYEDIAKRLNIELKVYQMNNDFKNIHNVPEQVLERMRSRWQDYCGSIQIPSVQS